MARSQHPLSSVTAVDGASLFDASSIMGERFNRHRVTIDYPSLRRVLDERRQNAGWSPADICSVIVSMDPASEGQQRFREMLERAEFEPDICHYRDAFVSLPPGRTPSDEHTKSIVSFSARLAYIAGLMARHDEPQLLLVTHSFELCEPLLDLAERRKKGRFGLAYFGSLIDFRWKIAGLQEGKLPLEFFDLEEHGQELLGFDLGARSRLGTEPTSGLRRY
ncbi:MAG: hypothetical protein U0793_27680 [Gemmataceae bacterium]